jgi:hypothetical protein
MTGAALDKMAGEALVQAMGTVNWQDARDKVARVFARTEPDPSIEKRLNDTRRRLDEAASPDELKQTQAKLAAEWQTRFARLLAGHPGAGTKLRALVKELVGTTTTTPLAIPGSTWETAVQNFIVGRYDRVQAAAQTWLTIMTTLFGVFSTVVVVSGAKTITEVKGGLPWQWGVLAGAAAVFLLAFAATMYGLFASWGGLGAGLQEEPKKRVWQELKDMWWPAPLKLDDIEDLYWQRYRRKYTLDRANLNRKRLHRSRVLGVAAVTCAGGLAFALIVNGFIY